MRNVFILFFILLTTATTSGCLPPIIRVERFKGLDFDANYIWAEAEGIEPELDARDIANKLALHSANKQANDILYKVIVEIARRAQISPVSRKVALNWLGDHGINYQLKSGPVRPRVWKVRREAKLNDDLYGVNVLLGVQWISAAKPTIKQE